MGYQGSHLNIRLGHVSHESASEYHLADSVVLIVLQPLGWHVLLVYIRWLCLLLL